MRIPGCVLALFGLTNAFATPSYTNQPERAMAVKAAFQRSWNAYYKYAFPKDALMPVSKVGYNDRNGWGASTVDALSTAIIMEDKQIVAQILDYVPKINFDQSDDWVNLFETTIRYLGGLVSAYDLLTGPYKDLAPSQEAVYELIKQAKHLADNLKVAFNTPTGIPDNVVLLSPTPHHNNSELNNLATIGTLVLEWTRLSDVVGEKTYGDLAQMGESYLLSPSHEAFPGLVGTTIFVPNGTFANTSGGWNGGADSFYEYLIKMFLYDPNRFVLYKERWIAAVESSMKYLASHPSTRPDLTYLAAYHGESLTFISTHLACFDGGNIILGGLVLKEKKYIDFGLSLTDSCYNTYKETLTGIGPEVFVWQDSRTVNASKDMYPDPPADQVDFYKRAGFWIRQDGGGYVLRPEVIESLYHAFRATGDPKYQDWAWDAFLAINRTCSVAGSGFSAISDVNAPGGGKLEDYQESFWFAEVLKYSYLIQATDAKVHVQVADNKWVFNTEAHPVRIP